MPPTQLYDFMTDEELNIVATKRIFVGRDSTYDAEENCLVKDGRSFPVKNLCDLHSEVIINLMTNYNISVCMDDDLPFAYHGIWYDEIYGAVDHYDYECHHKNIHRAVIVVYLAMTN